jgi:glycosyltransferase involved in cell wall biosynthesis
MVKITVLTSLYRCEPFLPDYLEALSRIEGKEQIEVLLLHNAPTENELALILPYLPAHPFVRHILIPEREDLYKTWNRGIRLAQGEYITVWNVDDLRFPQSILQQAEALDKNPQAAIAYGDIRFSYRLGVRGPERTNSPTDNSRKDFFKDYHMSCFQMWRKSIHETIGYYDEQFKCVADFDFQVRAAIHFPFVKTPELLGIYLEGYPHKLSFNGFQLAELNIIYLRYGAYERLNLFLLKRSKKMYRRYESLFFDQWKPWSERSLFGRGHKIKGLLIASILSSYWLLRQIAKKIIYPKGEK